MFVPVLRCRLETLWVCLKSGEWVVPQEPTRASLLFDFHVTLRCTTHPKPAGFWQVPNFGLPQPAKKGPQVFQPNTFNKAPRFSQHISNSSNTSAHNAPTNRRKPPKFPPRTAKNPKRPRDREDDGVRWGACEGLGNLAPASAAPALTQALEDEYEDVRGAAAAGSAADVRRGGGGFGRLVTYCLSVYKLFGLFFFFLGGGLFPNCPFQPATSPANICFALFGLNEAYWWVGQKEDEPECPKLLRLFRSLRSAKLGICDFQAPKSTCGQLKVHLPRLRRESSQGFWKGSGRAAAWDTTCLLVW